MSNTSLSSEDLRRVRHELWTNLQQIDTRLKQNYVSPHFRITTSSTSNKRTFSTNGHHHTSSVGDVTPSTTKRSRLSSSSIDEHHYSTSLPEDNDNNIDDPSSSTTTTKSLHSSIVPTNKIIKTKDDLISLVNRDQASTGRNRRMFGVLLNTLNKFKAEANAYNEQIPGIKRHEIERRLEKKQEKEREDQQHERIELIASKKICQQKLKLVNIKLELIERITNHEKQHVPLKNFIRTKTIPHIFYLPKGQLNSTIFERKLEECQMDINKEINDFKRDCQREIDLLDDNETLTNIPINNNNNKKRKISEHEVEEDDDVDEDDDENETLADLSDEITLSAPEIKSEIVNMAGPIEQPMVSTMRTVIFEKTTTTTTNEEDEPSMIEE